MTTIVLKLLMTGAALLGLAVALPAAAQFAKAEVIATLEPRPQVAAPVRVTQ